MSPRNHTISNPAEGRTDTRGKVMTLILAPTEKAPLWRSEALKSVKFKRIENVDQFGAWLNRAKAEVFTVVVDMTPELAERILANNRDNRLVREAHVLELASRMDRGEWQMNGEAIIISDTGELNDGQHRLSAVCVSGETVPMLLVFGPKRESRSTVDVGLKRSLANHLQMVGEKNSNALAAAVNYCVQYDAGSINAPYACSFDQAAAFLDKFPTVRDCVTETIKLAGIYRASHAQIAAAHFLCQRYADQAAVQFLARATDGLGINKENEPVSRFRARMQSHATGLKPFGKLEAAAVYVKCFNAHVRGRNLRAVSWTNSGPSAEKFPQVGA